MQTTIQNLKVSQRDISVQLTRFSNHLRDTCTAVHYQRTKQLISEMIWNEIAQRQETSFSL